MDIAGRTRGGRGDAGEEPAHHGIWFREMPDGSPCKPADASCALGRDSWVSEAMSESSSSSANAIPRPRP